MFVMQEVWYISKGMYTRRKALRVVYQLGDPVNSRRIIAILDEGQTMEMFGCSSSILNNIVVLLALEVTPKQYKWFSDKHDQMLGLGKYKITNRWR